MGSIPEELLLARIRRETEAREAAFAALQAALDKATGAVDQKILVAASKFSVGSVSATAIAGTILRTQVEAGFALAEQVTELEARFNDRVNSALASITETRTALADATQAFAQQTLTLQTQFNASSAKFTEQITALSTDTQALTTRTTTLESTVNNPTTGVAATSARLTTEETTRATADTALSSRTTTLESTVNNATTGVAATAARLTTEETTRATADTALSSRATTLESTVNNATTGVAATAARLTTEETTRANADAALSTRTTTLESTVNDATTGVAATSARLTTEETTRATADSALSSSISTVSATANSKNRTFTQSSPPTASAVGDLWVDTGNGNALKRWDGSAWVDTSVATGAISAAVTTEATARANADTALATRTTTLESTVNDAVTGVAATSARLTTEESTRATADSALSSSISTVSATANGKNKTFYQSSAPTASAVGDIWVDTGNGNALKRWNGSAWEDTTVAAGAISAAVTVEATARADADSALATRTTTLESTVNNATTGVAATAARLTTEESTRASADTALSSRTTTLESTVNDATSGVAATAARLTTEESTRAGADSALSTRATALESTVNSATDGNTALKARIASEETARANADSALSTSISNVSATASGKNKTFYQSSTPTASATGDLWIDTTDSNNVVKRWNGSNWVDTQVASGAIGAAVATESTARAAADGNLSGKYGLKVIAGNIVTGMNISSSTGSGTDVSDITFQGANFKIHNGSTGVVPFSVNTLTNTVTLTNVVVDTLAANIQITTPKILGATLKFNGSSTICCDTNDGSDNGILRMNGGGADGVGRGGQIDVIGNEYSTNASYAGAILITPGNSGNGAVYIRDRTTADRIKVDTGGNVVLNGATATNIYNASFQTAVLTDINLKGTKLTFADTGGTARIDMQESWGIKLTRSSDQHHFHTAGTALVVGSVIAGTSLTGDRIYFGGSGVYLYESGGVLYLHDGNGDRALT